MKKIIILVVILSVSQAFGQKKDQVFSKYPEISFTAANNGHGISGEYSNRFFNIKASSFNLKEGTEEAVNKEISLSANIFDQLIGNQSVIYSAKIGFSQRKMVNALWTWGGDENRINPDTVNRDFGNIFLGAGFMVRDLAKSPYMFLREIGINGEIMKDSNFTSFSVINHFMFTGVKIGKKGLEANPTFNWGVDNREIQRNSPGFFYSIGAKLRLYDYEKYYSIDILSIEYIGGNQAERRVSSTRVTVNVTGLLDFLSRKSKKEGKDECKCGKKMQYSYTAKTFPIPYSSFSVAEDNAPFEKEGRGEGRYQKFSDIEIIDVR